MEILLLIIGVIKIHSMSQESIDEVTPLDELIDSMVISGDGSISEDEAQAIIKGFDAREVKLKNYFSE